MYDMWYDYLGILPALKTVTFPHLTDLTLGENFEPENISEGFDFYCFLPAIKNAPSLKWLTLRKCAINLELLEEIHVNCPHLKSLILFGTPIVIEQNRLFQPIIPANSLLYLEIRDPVYFDVKALFLDYISSKYRCLKKLVLDLNTMQYDSFKFAQYYTMPAIDVSDSESGSENESERVQDQIQNGMMAYI
jgi:hypothetical protein